MCLEYMLNTCYNYKRFAIGFSDDIKGIRKRCFLSQEAFAKELGIAFSTVNRWEAGKAKSNYRTMKLIDDFCKKNNIDYNIQKHMEE